MSPTRKARAHTRKKRPSSRRSLALSHFFGRVLASLRESRKLAPEDLAAKSGIPLSRVIGLEKGAREPTVQDLFSLATALEVLPSQFMRRMDRLENKETRS